MEIFGLEKLKNNIVFHAGTKINENKVCSSGGRILNIVSIEDNLKLSILNAYKLVEKIKFDKMYYRQDIASKAFKYLIEKE